MKILALVRKVIRFEWGLWTSLYRWVFRRPVPTGPNGQAFSYAGAVTPVLVGIIVVSFIEIPVAHMLLPWETARIILLLLGVQTVFWMIGLLASLRVNPHAVSDSGLRVRYGTGLDVTIGWQDIRSIRTRMRSLHKNKTVVYEHTDAGQVLCIGVSSQTNLDVVLRAPICVTLRDEPSEPFSELRFYADDSAALAALARAKLIVDPQAPATSRG